MAYVRRPLSPSAAARWINCPGSALPALDAPEQDASIYAQIGTAAHEMFELSLMTGSDPEQLIGSTCSQTGHEFTGEMSDAVGHALDWIRTYTAKLKRKGFKGVGRSEHQLAIGPMLGVTAKECSGTADWTYDGTDDVCVVLDYKHGAGVSVFAEENEQAMLYAVGMALKRATEQRKPYSKYIIVIVQPRAAHDSAGPVREWEISHSRLMKWVQDHAKPAARAALRPNAPRYAGNWCLWCPLKGDCRPLAEQMTAIAKMDFADMDSKPKSAARLTPQELANVLKHRRMLEAWLAAVHGEALRLIMKGKKVPGWKPVRGHKSRAFINEQKTRQYAYKLGLKDEDITTSKLVSPAGMETAVQRCLKLKRAAAIKKTAQHFGRLIQIRPGPIHIAPDDDPRVAVNPAKADFTKE